MLASSIIFILVFAAMAVEAARARRNEVVQRARGGIEPRGDVYPVMRITYPVAFVVMIVEGAARGGAPRAAIVAGALVFGEYPDVAALAGMALIVASGLYTIHRDRMLKGIARMHKR